MQMTKFKILIIDGDHLMYRNLHQGGLANLEYPVNGVPTPTGILKGVMGSVFKFIKTFEPDIVYFAMTGGTCNFRREIYPDYKKRDPEKQKEYDEVPEGEKWSLTNKLSQQDAALRSILPDFGIRLASVGGYEADDCGMYLSLLYSKEPSNLYQTILVSDDWDWSQSVEHGAHVYRPMADQYITPENFKDITGIDSKLFIFEKAMLGDTSDKVPNLFKGCGPSTCRKIMNRLMETGGEVNIDVIIRTAVEVHSEKMGQKFVESRPNFVRNMNLMALNSGVLKNLHPSLVPFMSTPHYFDFNKATVHANKYGLSSLSTMLMHPSMSRLK